MKRRLRTTTLAKRDLRAIADYIARHDPLAAKRWVHRLRLRARKVARDPGTGRRVPEYGRNDLREVIVGNYRIIYRVSATEIVILRVLEGHQLLGSIDE